MIIIFHLCNYYFINKSTSWSPTQYEHIRPYPKNLIPRFAECSSNDYKDDSTRMVRGFGRTLAGLLPPWWRLPSTSLLLRPAWSPRTGFSFLPCSGVSFLLDEHEEEARLVSHVPLRLSDLTFVSSLLFFYIILFFLFAKSTSIFTFYLFFHVDRWHIKNSYKQPY